MPQTITLPKTIAEYLFNGDTEGIREFVQPVHDEPEKWREEAVMKIRCNLLCNDSFIVTFIMRTGKSVSIHDMPRFSSEVMDELLLLCYPTEEAQTSG